MCEKASLIYHTFTQFVYISTVFQFVKVLVEKFIMIVYTYIPEYIMIEQVEKPFLSSYFLAYSFWNKIWNFWAKISIVFRE